MLPSGSRNLSTEGNAVERHQLITLPVLLRGQIAVYPPSTGIAAAVM
jgi:hypothetical protein